MSQINTNEYIAALVDGDQKIIVSIYEEMYPKVRAFVLNNRGEDEDAREVFQKALYQLTARAKVQEFEIKSTFEGYLFTACKNLWRRELNNRKREVRNDTVLELVSEEQENSRAILEQERWELFEEMLQKLSDRCKALLTAYFNKVSYQEIVKKFDYASENAAFQRVFKCKKRLADLVKTDIRYQGLC